MKKTLKKEIEAVERHRMPEALVHTGSSLDLLIDHYADRAITATRWPALMGSLISVAAASKNKYVGHVIGGKATTLNIYGILVADTGDGKEMVQTVLTDTAKAAQFGLSGHVTSSAALHTGLTSNKEAGFAIVKDELGLLLENARANVGHHTNDFWRMLLECYGRANGTLLERNYADKKKNLSAVERPFVNAAFMSTPDTLLRGLNVGDINDGTLNRPIVFSGQRALKKEVSAPKMGDTVNVETAQLPEILKQALKNIETGPALDPSSPPTSAYELRAGDAMTAKRLENLYDECFEMTRSKDGVLWMRAFENIIKVCSILALFDEAYAAAQQKRRIKESELKITLQHVTYAERLLNASVNWVKSSISDEFDKSAGEKFISRCKRQIDVLAAKEGELKGWARRREVVQRLKGPRHPNKEVNADLDDLIELDHLIEKTVSFGGRKPTQVISYTREAVIEHI